jgi:hypothetical protein
MDYGILEGESPLLALRNLHREAVPCCISNGQLVFANPADQELCAGVWKVVEVGTNDATKEWRYLIPSPVVQAA